jgi:hypothetical protein
LLPEATKSTQKKYNIELSSALVDLNQGEERIVAAYSTVETLRHPFNVIAFQAFIDIVARRCGTLRKCCHTFRATAASLAGLDGSQCCCHPARLAVRMLAHYGSETRIRSYRTANGNLYLGGSVCPLLALSGHAQVHCKCLLSGVKADIVTYVSSTIYAVVVAPWGNTNVPHILSN